MCDQSDLRKQPQRHPDRQSDELGITQQGFRRCGRKSNRLGRPDLDSIRMLPEILWVGHCGSGPAPAKRC